MDSLSPLAFPSFPPSDPNEPVRQVGVRVNDQGVTEAFQTVTPPKPFNYEDLTPDQRDALQGAVYAANFGTQQDIEAHREVVLGFGASLPDVLDERDAEAAALFTLGLDLAAPGSSAQTKKVTMVRQLNQTGLEYQEEFKRRYEDHGCSCHVSPPCGFCVDPGNPTNLAEDDSMWETVPVQAVTAEEAVQAVGELRAAVAKKPDKVDYTPGVLAQLDKMGLVIGGDEGLGGVPQETLNEIMERNPLGFKGEKYQMTETQRTGPASNTIDWSKFKAPSHYNVVDDLKAATMKRFGAPAEALPDLSGNGNDAVLSKTWCPIDRVVGQDTVMGMHVVENSAMPHDTVLLNMEQPTPEQTQDIVQRLQARLNKRFGRTHVAMVGGPSNPQSLFPRVSQSGKRGGEEPMAWTNLSGQALLLGRITELEAQNAELMLALQKAQRTFLLLEKEKCLRSRDADGTESTSPPKCVISAVVAIVRALHDKVPTRTMKALQAIEWLEREGKRYPNITLDWSLDDEAWVITMGGRSWTCDEEMGGIIGAVESIKNRSVDPSAKSWPFEEFKREFDETIGKMTAEELEAAMDEIRSKEGATGEAPEMIEKHWEEAGEA